MYNISLDVLIYVFSRCNLSISNIKFQLFLSSSISSSAQNVNIVDSNPYGPSATTTDYSFTKSSDIATSSLLYGYDEIGLYDSDFINPVYGYLSITEIGVA